MMPLELQHRVQRTEIILHLLLRSTAKSPLLRVKFSRRLFSALELDATTPEEEVLVRCLADMCTRNPNTLGTYAESGGSRSGTRLLNVIRNKCGNVVPKAAPGRAIFGKRNTSFRPENNPPSSFGGSTFSSFPTSKTKACDKAKRPRTATIKSTPRCDRSPSNTAFNRPTSA